MERVDHQAASAATPRRASGGRRRAALDYVSAFAAGAGAAYATNLKLLPWFRSYRPAKAG
jgi:hypothetical protein